MGRRQGIDKGTSGGCSEFLELPLDCLYLLDIGFPQCRDGKAYLAPGPEAHVIGRKGVIRADREVLDRAIDAIQVDKTA